MATFLDSFMEGSLHDLDGLKRFVVQRTPDQVLEDARRSSVAPEDLPMIADMIRMFVKTNGAMARAKVLYAEGMRKIMAGPPGILSDNDMLSSMRNWALCCLPDAPDEAFAVIAECPQVIAVDPALAAWVTALLVQTERYQEAEAMLSGIDQIPLEDLLPKLEEAGLNFEMIKSWKDDVRANIGKRKMRDLVWWYDESAVGELPKKLIDMELDELAKHGISAEVLATIKTVVVFRASNDRKMWFCGFFDVKDPSPLVESGRTGRFQADFYNRTLMDRMGRFVGDGNVAVYAVH